MKTLGKTHIMREKVKKGLALVLGLMLAAGEVPASHVAAPPNII